MAVLDQCKKLHHLKHWPELNNNGEGTICSGIRHWQVQTLLGQCQSNSLHGPCYIKVSPDQEGCYAMTHPLDFCSFNSLFSKSRRRRGQINVWQIISQGYKFNLTRWYSLKGPYIWSMITNLANSTHLREKRRRNWFTSWDSYLKMVYSTVAAHYVKICKILERWHTPHKDDTTEHPVPCATVGQNTFWPTMHRHAKNMCSISQTFREHGRDVQKGWCASCCGRLIEPKQKMIQGWHFLDLEFYES
jgi:hypothetical protein